MDKEILRTGIIAELDAINLYEQMATMTKDNDIKKIFLDIAKEEKTHVGEFFTLLMRRDHEQEAELEEGKKEVEELIGK
jgi:rubrerythrin